MISCVTIILAVHNTGMGQGRRTGTGRDKKTKTAFGVASLCVKFRHGQHSACGRAWVDIGRPLKEQRLYNMISSWVLVTAFSGGSFTSSLDSLDCMAQRADYLPALRLSLIRANVEALGWTTSTASTVVDKVCCATEKGYVFGLMVFYYLVCVCGLSVA